MPLSKIKNPKKRKRAIIKKDMQHFKEGKLHSGSKKGPLVTSHEQAVAIALSEARKVGKKKKNTKSKK